MIVLSTTYFVFSTLFLYCLRELPRRYICEFIIRAGSSGRKKNLKEFYRCVGKISFYSFIILHFIGFHLFLQKLWCCWIFVLCFPLLLLLSSTYYTTQLYYSFYRTCLIHPIICSLFVDDYMLMIIHEFWWFLLRIYIQLIIRRIRRNWRNCELRFLIVKLSFDFTGKYLSF